MLPTDPSPAVSIARNMIHGGTAILAAVLATHVNFNPIVLNITVIILMLPSSRVLGLSQDTLTPLTNGHLLRTPTSRITG